MFWNCSQLVEGKNHLSGTITEQFCGTILSKGVRLVGNLVTNIISRISGFFLDNVASKWVLVVQYI